MLNILHSPLQIPCPPFPISSESLEADPASPMISKVSGKGQGCITKALVNPNRRITVEVYRVWSGATQMAPFFWRTSQSTGSEM